MNNGLCKVLIVDDEQWNLEVLESFLEGTGYKIIRASGGEEALQVLDEESIDLVLLDIMMPGIDGYGVCKKIKCGERTRFIPVVMVTSLDSKSAKVVAIEDGADDFITKPVDKTELLARVKSLIKVKSLHDQLENKYLEIKELQTLKDDLVRMLAHDFKSPLTGMMGYLDLIKLSMENGRTAEGMEFISSAQFMTDKLRAMIQDLLDLGRLEERKLPLDKTMADIFELVSENLHVSKPKLLEKNLTVVMKDNDPVHALVDRALFSRVIGNVLGNAIRYSPDGGKISLSLSGNEYYCKFSISNEGPQIPLECLEKIFEKFYRVQTRGFEGGTGIGLAFCDMAVKAHGGTIKAENVPENGCKFIIRVPSI